MIRDTTPTVELVGQSLIKGNITPPIWYRRIKSEKGRTDHIAIAVLADVWSWYRPRYTYDEETNEIKSVEKRFSSDYLQRSYGQVADIFDCNKETAKDAINLLARMGLIRKIWKNVEIGNTHYSNVLHLEPVVEQVMAITCNDDYKPLNIQDIDGNHFEKGQQGFPKYPMKHGFVYLIKGLDDNYKIGRSSDVSKRINLFGITLPFEIKPIHVIETNDMIGLESNLHEKFEEKRVRGEWFSLSQQDVEYIRSLE